MTPHLTRRALFATGTAALAMTATPSLASRIDFGPEQAAIQNIALAGRQRMLGQRISRAAFYIALGVKPEAHLQMLRKSRNQFETTQNRLNRLEETVGTVAIGGDLVLSHLNTVDGLWSDFDSIVTQISRDEQVSDDNLETLTNTNLTLLAASDELLKAILVGSSLTKTDKGLSMSIDLADRQRMLSQKMAKEAAMIGLGVVPELVQVSLAKNATLFAASLRTLVEGAPSIALPPAPEIVRAKLLKVRDIWPDYNRVVSFVATEGFASTFELGAIATLDDPLLVCMNDAISSYGS